MTAIILDEKYIDLNNSRYKTKLHMEAQSFYVDEEYKFEMLLGGEVKKVYIKHFGYVEVDEVDYSLVAFLEEYFSLKKSTIIRNIAKCFGLGGK